MHVLPQPTKEMSCYSKLSNNRLHLTLSPPDRRLPLFPLDRQTIYITVTPTVTSISPHVISPKHSGSKSKLQFP